jgi:predicted nucleotidyltransferase
VGIAERWKGFRELPEHMEQALDNLVPLFEQEGVLLAYVFGSLAKGRSAHDVGIAILIREKPAYTLRGKIYEYLGTERVDLVDLSKAPPLLRFEIVRSGRCLHARDKEVLNRFEMETIHLYRDTAYLRKRQLDVLKRRISRWSMKEE